MKTSFMAVATFLSLAVVCLADDPRVKVEFRRAQDEAAPGFTERQIEGTSQSVYVHDEANFVLTPDDIEEAKANKDERMTPMVGITLTRQGGEKMGKLTGEWVGKGSDPFLLAHAAIPVVVVSACLSRWFQRPAL